MGEPQGYIAKDDEENLAPRIIRGEDGKNYDQHLENLFYSLSTNNLDDVEILHFNLVAYTKALVPEVPEPPPEVFETTEAAMQWALEISSVNIWMLNDDEQYDAKERGYPDHRYGAFLMTGVPRNKYQGVTAHNLKNAALLCVIQRYREVTEPSLNPKRPRGEAVH